MLKSGEDRDNIAQQEGVIAFEIESAGVWDVLPTCFYAPFLENLRFIGRKAILEAIEERLFGLQECRELAIVGLGGIGKTQIVLQFATAAQLAPTDARPLEQA
ncbi:hypothetical protein PG989_005811 [Apiospora arundinis]